MFDGDRSGGTGMPAKVGIDGVYCCQKIVVCAEAEQSLAAWEVGAESGILRENWTSGSQIACAAITKPSAARDHVAALGNSEFGLRAAYESLILLGCSNQFCGIHEEPSILCQCIQIAAFIRMDRQS